MGKGKNGVCEPINQVLDVNNDLAIRYGDDLAAIQSRLDQAVRSDGSTPELASLTAPPSAEEMEKIARRYGATLETQYGRLIQNRRSRVLSDDASAYERMVDLNVISGSVLVQFSKVAGTVLRHHPDPRVRARAAEILIMVNQRGAIDMAGKWWRMVKNQGISRDELLSACQEGLLEAAEERDQKRQRLWREYDQARQVWLDKGGADSGEREPMPPTEDDVKVFDPDKASFYTYAKQKMYMRCQRYVEHNSGSRFGLPIPTAVYHQLSKIVQERSAIEDEGREATVDALLEREKLNDVLRPELPLKSSVKQRLVKQLLEEQGHKPSEAELEAKVRELRRADLEEKLSLAGRYQVSLNQILKGGDGDTELESLLQDGRQNTAREAMEEIEGENPELIAMIKKALTPEETRYLAALDLKEIIPGVRPAESAAELAEREGVSQGHMMKVIRSARGKLRKALTPEAIEATVS